MGFCNCQLVHSQLTLPQKIFNMKAMFVVLLAIAAVAVAEEEVADQKTDEQFLTAFRYGYPYASAAYVAPTTYVAPASVAAPVHVKYATSLPASVAAPVHVKYATSLPAYTYTAGAYPYTYPSTLGIRSTAYGPAGLVAGALPYGYPYGYPYATVAVAEKKE